MMIQIEANDLLRIAEEIEHNCDMLGYTDAEDAEDDIGYYVPVIRCLASDLAGIAQLALKRQKPKGGQA